MVEETEEVEEVHAERENTKLKLSLTVNSNPITFEYSASPRRFNLNLQAVGQQIPTLIGQLTGTATIDEEEALETHEYTVTSVEIVDQLIFSFDSVEDFTFAGQASALYDGEVSLEYQKKDESWIALSSITGDGANLKQSIADASMLIGDDVENPAKFPFVLRIRVAVKATAGTCSIWIKTE